MRIQDYETVMHVEGQADIERVLGRRFEDGMNSFWLSHGPDKYPALTIFVAGDRASLHYLPRDRHPGFRSIMKLEAKKPQGSMVVFRLTRLGEPVEVLEDSVVPFSLALMAAKEFSVSKSLPQSIQWFEL